MQVGAELPLMPEIQPQYLSFHFQHAYHRRAAPSSVGQKSEYKTHGLRAQMVEEGRCWTMLFPSPHASLDQEYRKHSPKCWGDSSHPSLPTSLTFSSSRQKKLLLWFWDELHSYSTLTAQAAFEFLFQRWLPHQPYGFFVAGTEKTVSSGLACV